MATWKKVIVSGSTANLAALQVDNLTSGQVVIGGGASNLSTTAINGTGNILATTGATGTSISGSFSGSFSGAITTALANASQPNFVAYNISTGQFSYAGTSSFTAATASYVTSSNVFGPFGSNSILSASYAVSSSFSTTSNQTVASLTQGAGVTSFTFNGSSAQTVSVSGASTLNTNRISKWTGAAFADSSLTDNGTTITGTTSIQLSGASSALTGSFTGSFAGTLTGTASYATQALTASFASNAAQLTNALTFGTGLTGTSYNGSTPVTTAISGAASLSANNVAKWTGTAFANSNITDTGTQVQIGSGASSGVTVAAGGINVTGNSTFNNNLTVTGDLTVAGTASFTNTDNLNIRDKFILINSGSNVLADSGWITQYNAAGSGSAFYLEAASAGTYGRFAMAYDVVGTSTSLTPDEYVVSAKINQASNPSAAPTWGSTTNGSGNMWITNAGDIFIYA